jgi:hypothetical protein
MKNSPGLRKRPDHVFYRWPYPDAVIPLIGRQRVLQLKASSASLRYHISSSSGHTRIVQDFSPKKPSGAPHARSRPEPDALEGRSGATFLVSSDAERLDHFFQGYFFHDADYVYGEAGFEEFSKTRGLSRLVREDGCYVQMERRGDRYRFSADYSGYKKIFYFWQRGFWVVSNSLCQIVEQLRRTGRPVVPNITQLAAAAAEGTFYPSGRGSFFSQLTTFDTVVQGVRCVPVDRALWIGASGVETEKDESRRPEGDYRNLLARFVSTWTARLQSLLRDPAIQIAGDLTGGLDSRVVFALLLNATGSAHSAGKRLQIRSSIQPKERKDHAVAANLCSRFGLSLNGRLKERPRRLSGTSSYRLWRDLCLGVYFPVYFPFAAMSPRIIHLGGGGGENHRPFYGQFLGAPSARTFVAARSRNIARRAARPDYRAALHQAVDIAMDGAPSHLDVLAVHYRHFRNRFHSGREPQYKVTLQPLASRLLDDCTAAAGEARFRNAQMHYDILHNLHPELLDLPFDKRSKRPSSIVRRSMTSIQAAEVPAGECFIENAPMAGGAPRKEPRAIDLLQEEFSRAKSGFAAEFLGSTYIRRADRAVEAAARAGTVPGPIDSKRIAVVLTAGMFES